MELRVRLIWSLVFVYLLTSAPGQAEEIDPVYCALLPDSVTLSLGGIAELVHPFGSDTTTYPNEFDPDSTSLSKAFSQVFRLYLTDSVSNRWSRSEWEGIVTTIMNNDTTTTDDDVFGRVWGYFVRDGRDLNPYYAGVRYTAVEEGDTFTTIDLYLYDASDIPCPCTSEYGQTCNGYSQYLGDNKLVINANDSQCPPDSGCANCAPITLEDMLGMGIAHELQHLCFAINDQNGYAGINETLSTLAEYFMDVWRPLAFDIPYDASFMDIEHCDVPSCEFCGQPPKYQVYKPWMIHLYEVFKGNTADPTDDLLYRWIRNDDPSVFRLYLSQLADVLWDDDFDWMGGADAVDRFTKAYGDYLVAKFCNAPSFSAHGEFGHGPVNTVEKFGYFLDNCDTEGIGVPEEPVDCPPYENSNNWGCWNVRVLAPSYELTDDNENVLASALGVYQNGDDTPAVTEWDTSRDYIDVYVWGTDYIVFRAGAYFEDGGEHELRIRVGGTDIEHNLAIRPIGRIMAYGADQDTLQMHPDDLLFVEPMTFSPATTSGDTVLAETVTVTDFGRSVKVVVLAIGAAGTSIDRDYPYNGFVYEYEYGVFTPGPSTRTWQGDVFALGDVTVLPGGTLDVGAGTRVKVWPFDLAQGGADEDRIELNVEGQLVVDGTSADPIVFDSWDAATTWDWVGFYFDSQSAGGTFDHCVIGHALYGIESYAPVTVANTTIESCIIGVLARNGGSALVQNCTLSDIDYMGIIVENNSTVVRNSTVQRVGANALDVRYPAGVVVRNSTFKDSDQGVYLRSTAWESVDIDSSCIFSNNDIGINGFGTGTSCVIKNSTFDGNTSNAILCDGGSSPVIDGNGFNYNAVAVYCRQSSSPTITNNSMVHFTEGVVVTTSSNPDIGHYSSTGNNQIAYPDDENGKYVHNYTASTIYAQNNCWNVGLSPCAPAASWFSGSVDRTHPICCMVEEPQQGFQIPAEPGTATPVVTALKGIVPNPFNPTTTIHYDLATQAKVDLKVYDVAGRLVRALVGETRPAGSHQVVWDGRDGRGNPTASGVYFVRMIADSQVFTKKMVLLK